MIGHIRSLLTTQFAPSWRGKNIALDIAGMMLLVAVVVLTWGLDKEYGTWSSGFLLAAWVMPEPGLRPALILLPVAGLSGIASCSGSNPGYEVLAGACLIFCCASLSDSTTSFSISVRLASVRK